MTPRISQLGFAALTAAALLWVRQRSARKALPEVRAALAASPDWPWPLWSYGTSALLVGAGLIGSVRRRLH
jgi:hypothetical protein